MMLIDWYQMFLPSEIHWGNFAMFASFFRIGTMTSSTRAQKCSNEFGWMSPQVMWFNNSLLSSGKGSVSLLTKNTPLFLRSNNIEEISHSVQFAPISGKNLPFFGKLYNSVQSKDIFMISKVWSRIMIILSCLVICRPNLTSRLSSTTPGSKMSDMGNLDR